MLASIVVPGCGQKQPVKPDISSTNTPSVSVTTGISIPSPAALPVISNSIPLRTIRSLSADSPADGNSALVRLRGTVLDAQPGEFIVLHDLTGTIFAQTRQAILPKVKELVDVQGQPDFSIYPVSLKNAVAVPATAYGSTNLLATTSSVRPAILPLLTNVWQIRDLPAEKAAWHYPVRLSAVVTVNAHVQNFVFIQDNSAGISVRIPRIAARLSPGDLVNIEGSSDPGGFSPIVLVSNVTVLGTAPLPEAKPTTLFQLATGEEGSQWIQVHGVVHSMTLTNGMAQLNLRDLSGMIPVKVPASSLPTNLLDAIVRINGCLRFGIK